VHSSTYDDERIKQLKRDPKVKVLTFPDNPIGTIAALYADSQTISRGMPARGTIVFPAGSKLHLHATWVATENMSAFKSLPKDAISTLSLANLPVSDLDLTYLESLTDLDGLTLYDDDEITDDGITSILKLKNLSNLELGGTRVTGRGISRLSALVKLRVLRLDRIVLDREGLQVFAKLPALAYLTLGNSELTDGKLAEMQNLKSLTFLSLHANPGITAAGMKYLIGDRALENLELNGCSIGPQAIKYLKQLKNLKNLTITLSGWSAADKSALVKALPECKIGNLAK
ncbi:MAG TPA: hypothetical protein V6C72_02905, partial [Chroococcales cyanobacterium]